PAENAFGCLNPKTSRAKIIALTRSKTMFFIRFTTNQTPGRKSYDDIKRQPDSGHPHPALRHFPRVRCTACTRVAGLDRTGPPDPMVRPERVHDDHRETGFSP